MIDVERYLETLVPNGKRSSLYRFATEILTLSDRGCSLKQIVDFLSLNGQEASIANVSKFIKKMARPKRSEGNQSGTNDMDLNAVANEKNGVSKIQKILKQTRKNYPKR